jgi:hypothetical protein
MVSTSGSHQLALRRMSLKVFEGAIKVSTTRSTWLSPEGAAAAAMGLVDLGAISCAGMAGV